jgi:hypothetical protein
MNTAIEQQMVAWDAKAGDRVDPVAQALRRFYLRVACCPCMNRPCHQCVLDREAIEEAWTATQKDSHG